MGETSWYFDSFSIWSLYHVPTLDSLITHLDAVINPCLTLPYLGSMDDVCIGHSIHNCFPAKRSIGSLLTLPPTVSGEHMGRDIL